MLRKQLVPVIFGQGVKTKNDSKTQLIGTFRKAANVVFETLQLFKKRNGFDALELRTLSEQLLENVNFIARFDKELLAIDANRLYGYSQTINRALDRGPLYSVVPETFSVLNNSANHDIADVAITGNIAVYVYRQSVSTEARYSIKDLTTGAFLASNVLVGTCDVVKVAIVQNTAFFVYNVAGNLNYRKVNIYDPQTLSAPVVIANNVETTKIVFDIVSASDRFFVAYNSTVLASRVRVLSIDSTGFVSGGIGITGAVDAKCVSLQITFDNLIVVAFAGTASVHYAVVNYLLSNLLLVPTLIETISNCVQIDIQKYDGATYKFLYEISATNSYDHHIRYNTGNSTGTVGTAAVFKRSCNLLAESVAHSGNWFAIVGYSSALQSTMFLLDEAGNIVSKALVNTAQGLNSKGSLPHSKLLLDGTTLLVPALQKTRLVADNGTFFSLLGVSEVRFDFDVDHPYQNVYFANNLHISGGLLQIYDGAKVVEHGFNVWPEKPTVTATPTTGGNMSDGNYGLVALYKWTDNEGQDQYSVPSETLNVVLSGGTSTQRIQVTVPSLRLTAKENVVVELYRTEDNGVTYYLDASVANNPAADTVALESTSTDAALISKQLLYTTGGILENTAAPAVAVIGVHTAANRVVIVSENRNQIQYSKVREDGKPVEFNDALIKDVDPVGGKITAVASMDEKLVIFEEQAIFYISGSGPNNAGEQDSYTDPERISIDTGCINPNSVVLMPQGLMFRSKKGIYLLGRDLSVQYIGADVEAYNDLQITSAKLIPTSNQVRFTTLDGNALVYNYFTQTWATFDNFRAKSAEIIDNVYHYVRSDGQIFKENVSSFADYTSSIGIDLETGWMNFASLQGFQRVYKLLILGNYKGPHKLKVQIAYDYNEAWVQEVVIDPLQFLDGTTYGEVSPYGGESPYGGSGNVYQARIDLTRQKCQSIKVRITELQDVAGPGVELNGFTLQVGAKSGTNKLRANRQFGTN